ncbi:MAG: DegV family protein [Coriobacteriales bacterium]|jgi:DegV family protein with EDD domain|nr:DegV family protein [Coriobacteriales bacterium]
MALTRLVVDSTCDMPKALFEKYGIAVLPLQVILGEKSYRDGYEINAEQLYDAMRQGILPKTSQINAAEADALFRGICEAGDNLIYLSFSSGMSGSYQVAHMVLAKLQEEFPELHMAAVDSEGGGMATGLVAMQTARWIASGKEFDEIILLMAEMVAQVQHLITVDNLNWLVKGGRLHRSVGYIGTKLMMKPVLNVVDKTVQIMRIARGRKAALRLMAQTFLEKAKEFPAQLVGIQHTDDFDAAKQVEQMISAVNQKIKTVILPVGCVLSSHVGIGAVGLFFFRKPVRGYDLLSESEA